MHKQVATEGGMNSNIDAAVAGSAAIQLMGAMLRLGEWTQPAIDIYKIIVDKDAFSNRLVGVALL